MSSLSLSLRAAPPLPFVTLGKNANTNLRRSTTTIKQQARPSPHIRCAATAGDEPDLPGTAASKQRLRSRLVRCTAVVDGQSESATTVRRSGNFEPNRWSYDRIQSLTNTNVAEAEAEAEEKNIARRDVLKEQVRRLLIEEKKEVVDELQLVDHVQQLGVGYHFKDEIKDALGAIHASLEDVILRLKDNLHATALLFRLLRENGFDVSQDIFRAFLDEDGNLNADCLRQQTTRGMLSLYEASYYGKEGEQLLDDAMDLTTEHLRRLMETAKEGSLGEADGYHDLREHVAHALELPLNWRMLRLQARWFIETCGKETNVNPPLLELAKLDFNAVQQMYRRELAELSRWWKNLDLPRKLPFFRDRLMENYLWTTGWCYEPENWASRELLTKGNCFITMIDDVYDVYGTLDELEVFTEVMDRWDVNSIDELPEYMKLCFLAIFNEENAAGYKVMKEKGLDIIPYVRRAWANLCKSYMREAKWYHERYTPKVEEYLDNAWISISCQLILTHAYCMNNDLSKEALESYSTYQPLMQASSTLLRLHDDLATTTLEIERGDVSKSIQCCMKEKNISEAEARLYIKEVLVKKYWKQLNGDRASSSSFEEKFKHVVVNIPRMSQFFYQHGDAYGMDIEKTKNQVYPLLFEPIKL